MFIARLTIRTNVIAMGGKCANDLSFDRGSKQANICMAITDGANAAYSAVGKCAFNTC